MPNEIAFRTLRKKSVPENIVRAVEKMYRGANSSVRIENGQSGSCPVNVGVHQRSTLSPFLLITVMEVTKRIKWQELWVLPFADDLVATAETKEDLQE